MTYRTRTLLQASVGLVVLAGLGALAYFLLYKAPQAQVRQAAEARLALDLFSDRVIRIEMERGDVRVVLERAGDGKDPASAWRMLEPIATDADGVTVEGILGAFERMDAERRLPVSELGALSNYGLSPPRAHWRLVRKDAEPIGFQVGKENPFDNQIYLQVDGASEVILVQGRLENSLIVDPFQLREKRLLRFEPSQIEQVSIEAPGRKGGSDPARVRIELHREQGVWSLRAPFEDRADSAEAKRLLHTLHNLTARAFPGRDLPDSSYGLDHPGWKVRILAGPDGPSQEVWLSRGTLPSNNQKVFARTVTPTGFVAEVPAYQLEAIDKTPFALQAKAPLEFDPQQVARIKVSGQAELVVLERTPGADQGAGGATAAQPGWALISPVAATATGYKVQALLAGLAGLKALRFGPSGAAAELESVGLTEPIRTIAVFDENNKQIGQLRIGKATAAGTWVLGTSRDKACLVPTQRLDSLPLRVDQLTDAPPAPAAKKP